MICALCGESLWTEDTVMAKDLGVNAGFAFAHKSCVDKLEVPA